jgi:DNA excision repair protein ERCC-4
MMTSYVDTSQITNDLYRWNPQYCGLNSTEYEELAGTTALNKTGSFDSFVDQMMEELKLNNGGTCDNIFQIASMQSGDTQDSQVSDVIGTFVQLLSFDMSSDFETTSTEVAEIFANVGGAFSSGWISSVYASQGFAATLSVGCKYNNATGHCDRSTFILGFDISGIAATPFSYAEIPGHPLNQYSADLYQGQLRVVTTEWFWSETTSSTSNKIFVLKVPNADGSEGPEMLLTGKTDHVGKPNEQVMSVRFMETKAYIVTFERTDPFYVFNLTDPSNPQKIGELEIPGFSSYLHPIEIDGVPLMLGIGSHVNETTGWETGLKISLFNVSDPMNLKEITVLVDEGAYSSGSWDFKSFRYLPLSQKLILPKTEYTWTDAGNFDGFVVYDITLDKIAPSYNIQHASSYAMHYGCWYSAYMPARSLVFQSKLTTILSHSVMSTDLDTGEKLWNLTLQGLDNTVCSPYFY